MQRDEKKLARLGNLSSEEGDKAAFSSANSVPVWTAGKPSQETERERGKREKREKERPAAHSSIRRRKGLLPFCSSKPLFSLAVLLVSPANTPRRYIGRKFCLSVRCHSSRHLSSSSTLVIVFFSTHRRLLNSSSSSLLIFFFLFLFLSSLSSPSFLLSLPLPFFSRPFSSWVRDCDVQAVFPFLTPFLVSTGKPQTVLFFRFFLSPRALARSLFRVQIRYADAASLPVCGRKANFSPPVLRL